MDHLDLEGMLSAAASSSSSSSSSTTSWIMPPFDQQEANFLSTSRQMLEPIMEETSEDEENQNWSQFESVWSSESDTGSVIRIELHNDPDSVSERDFACPAKRPRRDDLLIVEEIPPLRKYQRNESLLLNVDMAQETFRKRFDEIYSDSDSLSFNSLSRSSSLIQFESLERQLQNDLSSAIGNSTPSLLIGFDTNDNKGSDSSLRRFESSDGRLHQTYFDLDKIDFNNTLNVFNEDQCSQVKSDSESSDTSILSHEERILKPKNICNNSNSNNINSDQRSCYKGKSSAENLSEDSGYCEHISALRIKSKSIPNFLKTNHKLSEEDEFENHKSLEMIFNTQNQDDHEIFGHSRKFENSVGCFGKENFPLRENQRDILKTKIDGKRCSSSSSLIVGEQIEQQRWYNCEYSDDGGGKIYNSSVGHEENEVKNKMNSKQKKTLESSYVSSSLPDVRIQYDHVFDGNKINDYNNFSNERISDLYKYANKDQFSTVSSLPNNLNLIGDSSVNSNDSDYNQDDDDDDNFAWNLRSSTSVRSENRLSASYSSGRNLVKPTQNFIAASYNNLTLLDYSGRSHRSSFTMSDYSGNSKRNSREFELGKGNFLLDEISSYFDRNLSILSDRDQESDLLTEFLDTERKSSNNQKDIVPPKVPARRSNSAKEHRVTAPVEKPPRKIYSTIKTFDLDPTNLQTSYAESLEKCNFDPKELSNTDLELLADYSIPVKRDFVVSTPNLNAFRRVRDDDDLCHVSSAHNSMNPIPGEKKLGILLPAGNSRNSLGKGVSFCPVVSEISWREQSSEECIDPDSLENLNIRSHDSNIGTTQTSIDSTDGMINNTEIQSIEITFEYAKPNTNEFEPKKIQPQQQHEEEVDEQEKHLEKQQNDQQQQLQHTEDYQQQELQQHEFKQHEEKQAELKQHEDKQHESNTAGNKRSCSNAIVSNVAIVEQSISSAASNEIPSTSTVNNCASSDHKNNKMDKDQVISDRDNKNVLKSNIANIKNNNININNNNNNNNKISSASVKNTTTMPSSATANTGTDLLSSKFKPKPDEKHHKNSFLSRFTGGFRFSLRRKKKPSVVDDKNSNEGISKPKKSIADGAVKSSTSSTKNKTPDFIYIPLKGPLPEQTIQNNKTTLLSSCADKNIDNTRHLSSNGNGLNRNGSNGINHVLLGKPPLPKQPPRVVGVCEKIRACQRQQSPPSEIPLNPSNSGGNVRHAPVIRSSSQPREIDERFLDNERRFYYNDQLNGTMNGNGCNDDIIRGRPPTTNSSTTKYHNVKSNGNGGGIGTNGGSKIGLIETNLDTHETVISGKTRSLMELGPHSVRLTLNNQNTCNEHTDKTIIDGTSRRPHKSMEFLLDKENQKNVLPPENELQKSHDSTTALSEHQLRVQASLQRLNIPEWFRQYSSTPKTGGEPGGYKPGSFTRKRASDSGRWAGLNSKTTSLSSLGSQRSDRSPLMLSPSAHSHHGGQTGFSRWSTSHLNSTQTSPSVSTRGSFCRGGAVNSSFISGNSVSSAGNSSIRNSFRQPYLGWRSQEKLSQPRTPHERLASSLLTQQPQKSSEPAVTPEIQSSIKEVTSAIVHYVNDQTNRTSSRSRSASPNSRKCWLESSFVGIRQLDSPQTPNIENSFNPNSVTTTFTESGGQTSDIFRMNGVATPLPTLPNHPERSSLGSASLEDVLASLLGLPTDSYRSTGDTVNELTMMDHPVLPAAPSPSNLQVLDLQNRFRRHSEGDAQKQQQQKEQQQQQQKEGNNTNLLQQTNQQKPQGNTSEISLHCQTSRRVSLDSSESKTTSELFIKCRNTKCDQSTTPIDAKKFYKSCHNCSHLYCSRECRRAHWEKHRKACLHSRVSNLCRQVLSSCKDDMDALRHLSLLARKGYLSQGRGVVRILFRSPENAEGFIKNGFQCLGEASYVRWPDLMPAEMGLELYTELLRLSTEYKPESKMLIYVAICVVSEAPGSATAPVKWERQLVSRCAKLKLSKLILNEFEQNQHGSVVVKEQTTNILILTFDPQKRISKIQRELILNNIQLILNQRGVILRKHYPEILQRLQTFVDGQTDRFLPVTIHPRDTQTGQGFVCIIMPHHGDNELIKLPTGDNGNNHVITIDVGEYIAES